MADLSLVFDLLARDRASAPIKEVGDEAKRTGDKLKEAGDESSGFGDKLGGIGGSLAGGLGTGAGALAGLGAASAGVFAGMAAGAAAAVFAIGGIGISAAAQDASVQASFASLGDHVKSSLADSSAAFVPMLNGVADQLGNAFDSLPLGAIFEQIAPVLDTFSGQAIGALAPLLAQLPAIVDAGLPIVQLIGDQLGPLMATLGPVIGQLMGHLTGAAGALAGPLFEGIGQIVEVLPDLLGPLLDLGAQVFPILLPVIAQVASLLAGALGDTIQALIPSVMAVVGALAQVVPALLPLVAAALELLPVLAPIVATVAGFAASLILQLLPAIQPIIPMITGLASVLAAALIDALMQTMPALQSIIGAVMELLPALMPLIPALLSVALAIVPLIPVIANLVAMIVQALMPIIMPLVGLLVGLAGVAAGLLVESLGAVISIVTTIVEAFGGMLTSVGEAIGGVVTFVSGIALKIANGIGDMGKTLFSKGVDLINGLINGAASILKNIGQFFLDKVPSFIRGPFEKALGIASPSKVFHEYGQNIGQGLINGIASMQPGITDQVGQAAQEILDQWQRGGAESVFEDYSFRGMSDLAAQYNDQVSELMWKAGIDELTSPSAKVVSGLQSIIAQHTSPPTYTSPSYDLPDAAAAAGGGPTYITTVQAANSPEAVARAVEQTQRTNEFLAGAGIR
jgi:phage-related protein